MPSRKAFGMSETTSRRTAIDERTTRNVRLTLLAMLLWAVAACAAPFLAVWWDGMKTQELTHAELLRAIEGTENPAAAIEVGRHHVLELMAAIRKRAEAEGREGAAARIALEYFRKEANR